MLGEVLVESTLCRGEFRTRLGEFRTKSGLCISAADESVVFHAIDDDEAVEGVDDVIISTGISS